MKTINKCCLFLFIIFLATSIYKDLHLNSPSTFYENDKIETLSINVIKVKVKHGETVLSIVENINPMDKERINIQQVMNDFKEANPNADPFQLEADKYYYFPLYTSK